ncbi:MAG TPA: DMT family transporter, partial [Alphaproteobacteria bacterium]
MSVSSSKHLKTSDLFLAIGIIAVWGANAAIGKLAVPQIPVFAFLATRFAITGLLLLPFVNWKKEHVCAAFRIAILLNVLHYGLIYSAMPYLDASALALIQQTQVPAAILLGWFFFKEPISLKLGIGIMLGFAGL